MKTTRDTIAHRLLVPALAVLAGTLLAQEKNDAKLTIDIPTAVQATIRQEQGDGKVNDFRRVNENDGTTYIVGLLIDGKNYSLALDAAGRVMSKVPVEETDEPAAPTVESLPAAIKKTLARESTALRSRAWKCARRCTRSRSKSGNANTRSRSTSRGNSSASNTSATTTGIERVLAADEVQQVREGLWCWQRFQPSVKVDCTSTAIRVGTQFVFIDPSRSRQKPSLKSPVRPSPRRSS